MSDQGLQDGAFFTTLNGRRCTAVPKSDGQVATTTSSTTAATPTVAAPSPPVVAGNDNIDNVQPGAVPAVSPALGGQGEIGATAASTTNSISSPDPNTTSSIASDSLSSPLPQAQASPQEDREQESPPPPSSPTSPSSPSFSSPSPSPSSPSPPSPSLPADPPQSLQTPQQSQPTAENSETDNTTAPTNPSDEVDNVGNPQQAPVPTLVTPVNDNTPDVAVPTAGVNNGAAAEGNNQPSSGISDGDSGSGSGNRPATAVVAGSVAGGVALVSIVAFLLWFWRKKAINKRRSSLLTPLTIAPGSKNGGGGGGGTYIIDRDSLGPTGKSEKFKAAVGANFKRMKGKVSKGGPSVDLNRGTSQFMGSTASQHSRDNSSVFTSPEVVTGKDRFKDWWSRLTADVNFNWKLRNDRSGDPDPSAARDMQEKNATMGSSQPDFLTLLGMDESEVQREAKKRQAGAGSGEKRGSADSNHFLGGLSLNFNSSSNPFSDVNALPHDSAKPAPLMVSPDRSADPFSDDKAIKGPSSYVADVRRSRGHPDDAKGGPSKSGNPPKKDRLDSVYRESLQSDFGPRRNKFRSDPFDLERPELLGSLSSTAEEVNMPRRAHTRTDSYSSKYSSGFSLGDWSDPGPDVGPAATRWDGPTEERVESKKGGRDGSVGKAM